MTYPAYLIGIPHRLFNQQQFELYVAEPDRKDISSTMSKKEKPIDLLLAHVRGLIIVRARARAREREREREGEHPTA